MKLKILDKYKYIDILFLLVIGIIYIWNLKDVNRILAVDEFVYWGVGASIAGFDWKDLLSVSEYYSFGYSFILIPLFLLVKIGLSMKYALKIAIIFNSVFIALSYLISLKLINMLFVKETEWFKKIVGFFVTLYIGNLIHMNMAWAETWLIFVYWFLILVLICFLKTPNYKNAFVLILTTAYIFTVHMRALGVVIAVGVVLLLYVGVNFSNLKKGLVIFIIGDSIVLGVVVTFIKKVITSSIFSGSEQIVNSVNNVSTNIKTTGSFFSIMGLIDLIMSMMGKLFYAGSASFLLAIVGTIFAISLLIKSSVKSIKKEETWQLQEWIVFFCLLSFLAENGVAAIFKCLKYFSMDAKTDLWDTIVFGRYSDFVIGPMIILGVFAILHVKKYKVEIAMSMLFYMLCALVVQFQFNIIEFYSIESSPIFRTLQSIWMRIIYNGTITNFAYYATFISVLFFVGLCFGGIISNRKILASMFIAISLFWAFCGIKQSGDYIQEKIAKEKHVATVYDIIAETGEEVCIYQVYDEQWKSSSNVRILQWMLGERTIYMQNVNAETDISYENAIILCDSSETEVMALLSDQLEYVYNSGVIAVYVSKNNPYYREVIEKAQAMRAVVSPEISNINLADVVTDYSYVKMNGDMYYNYNASNGAYLTENMGVILNDGIYEFSIDIRVRDCNAGEEIGYIKVGEVDGDVQCMYPLRADEFIEKERKTITVPVRIEGYKETYVGIFTYGEAAIRIYDISYQKKYDNIEVVSDEVTKLLSKLPASASLCYVDSDDSAESGFPYHSVYQWSYLGGKMLPYKRYFEEDYYLVEKSKDRNEEVLLEIMQIEKETENYYLLSN